MDKKFLLNNRQCHCFGNLDVVNWFKQIGKIFQNLTGFERAAFPKGFLSCLCYLIEEKIK